MIYVIMYGAIQCSYESQLVCLQIKIEINKLTITLSVFQA